MRCSNRHCQSGLEAYSSHEQYRGLCLNCLDDDRQDAEMLETELRLDAAQRERSGQSSCPCGTDQRPDKAHYRREIKGGAET